MGLIRAFRGAVSTTLADQWKEYIYCDALSQEILVAKGRTKAGFFSSNRKRSENIISDGSKIAVNEGQAMLIVENGRVLDVCTEPGGFVFESGTEPSLFCEGSEGVRATFQTMAERFGYGGQPANDQRVYYVNLKEIMDNKVGIGDVPFRDSEFGFTIKLKGYGTYTFRIADPLLFFTNVCANVKDTFPKLAISEQLRTEVQQAMQPALGRVAMRGIPYDQITLYMKDIVTELNTELCGQWMKLRGMEMTSMSLASLRPDEESAKKINQFQESRVYTNAGMMGARLGTAQANAMETAAGNTAGAFSGYVGMGMAQQAGGMNPSELYRMGQMQQNAQGQQPQGMAQPSGQPPQSAAQNAQGQKPQEGWTCSACGTLNRGKFCMECGAKKPSGAPLYQCDKCGWQPEDPMHPPKFCPECGDRFDENDRIQQ